MLETVKHRPRLRALWLTGCRFSSPREHPVVDGLLQPQHPKPTTRRVAEISCPRADGTGGRLLMSNHEPPSTLAPANALYPRLMFNKSVNHLSADLSRERSEIAPIAPTGPPKRDHVTLCPRPPRVSPAPPRSRPLCVLPPEMSKPPATSSRGFLLTTGEVEFAFARLWLRKWSRLQTALCRRFVDAQTDSYRPRNKEQQLLRRLEGASGWTVLRVRTVHVRVGCHLQPANTGPLFCCQCCGFVGGRLAHEVSRSHRPRRLA